MIKNDVYAIGVMSGTSLDGVDLVYVKFDSSHYENFIILHCQTIPYATAWKQLLQNAIHSSPKELKSLDVMYGNYLGDILNNFITNHNIDTIDFIASHGHTILHEPEKGVTLQIGDGHSIAQKTNAKVIYDFRTQDVQLGGQGAPLVPIGDALLFSNYDFCLNLGGFSNISFQKEGERIAFDICPVNIVLNHYANILDLEFDASGKLASEGIINKQLLKALNDLPFYQKTPPKSLGLEWVQEHIFPLIGRLEKDIPSILATFVEHIAMQIGEIIYQNNSVLVTGGGFFNTFLIDRIQFYGKNTIPVVDEKLINYKEALIFSFLGLLKLENKINCLKSVTGALKNHSSGVIICP